MDPRREHLVRLLNRRRRRVRLMLVCVATALACGVVAGLLAPQVLVGSVPQAAELLPAGVKAAAPAAPAAGEPLSLSDRVGLDPRETQANAIRWAALTEADRRSLLDQYWQLSEMDEAQRDRLVQQYTAFRELPEKRQEALLARARKLKEFVKTLSPQDQAVLESMGDRDRAARLMQLWQARHGTW